MTYAWLAAVDHVEGDRRGVEDALANAHATSAQAHPPVAVLLALVAALGDETQYLAAS